MTPRKGSTVTKARKLCSFVAVCTRITFLSIFPPLLLSPSFPPLFLSLPFSLSFTHANQPPHLRAPSSSLSCLSSFSALRSRRVFRFEKTTRRIEGERMLFEKKKFAKNSLERFPNGGGTSFRVNRKEPLVLSLVFLPSASVDPLWESFDGLNFFSCPIFKFDTSEEAREDNPLGRSCSQAREEKIGRRHSPHSHFTSSSLALLSSPPVLLSSPPPLLSSSLFSSSPSPEALFES